ncbi:hypothetical protein CRES_1505 [Corynebacterium resistens DSM 45100]|uniref:Uncharacterized protein n=1 Tax=Corynebacterium resistens (strain DSM 45100 / JCM 12819 / GTC 2026 / SICGH 158) TaxID=662755 RepID=F8DZU4_CORRG|nr:hypothetical protein CRES_1505 [Corynebacterium resistens DSM 45100]
MPTSMCLVVAATAHSSGIGGGDLRHEVVDSEGRVVHADYVRSLGDLQMSLGDLFRRWPALAAEGVMPEA